MTHAKYLSLSPECLAEMRRLWSAGLPTWAIAEDMGVSVGVVQSAACGLDFPHRNATFVMKVGHERKEGRERDVERPSRQWRTRYVSHQDVADIAESLGIAWSGTRNDLVALNAALYRRDEAPVWVLGLRS